MNKLKIELENCYWIKNLDYEFDFSNWRSFSIYAPNWIMKTSFTKTLNDYIQWNESKDLAFPNRETKREILDENGDNVAPNKIFVIDPYDWNFSSEKISLLLVNSDLRARFSEIYEELEIKENEIIKKLKEVSKSSDCKWEIIWAFSPDENKNFLEILLSQKDQISSNIESYNFKYNDVFDTKGKVKEFLGKYNNEIDDYIHKYNEIIESSNFFSAEWNKFWTYQANEIWEAISDNSFFDAWHKLKLKDTREVSSSDEYKAIIEWEKDRVINDTGLKKIFEKIDKAIDANTELRSFHKIINKDNSLLIKLKNYEEFKKKVWLYYFYIIKEDILNLLDLYEDKKNEINAIIEEAKSTTTLRQEAIDEFNNRFINMPFILSIENQEDAILQLKQPILKFHFKDWEDIVEKDKNSLLKILSQWEKRALYLLNIIFEIQARKKEGQETLFIFDDIVESFDYKNKYAIIEYLKDISENNNFYQIILTHNFDFYRTINYRNIIPRECCLMATKSNNWIMLIKAYWLHPFTYFKRNFHNNPKCFISMIPFARNLAEYCWKTEHKNKLTSLLHIKDDTENITITELLDVFNDIIENLNTSTTYDPNQKVIEFILDAAEQISNETEERLNLENKIVLSIAIRLLAEIYMKWQINDEEFFQTIGSNQTRELIEKYKEIFPEEQMQLKLLEDVNLITPESIHLNSFMYEPILDMSEDYLKKLYWELKNLHNNT